jgi:lipopolysaccharide export system permease protein
MTGILSQYLMRTILTSTALVLVVLLALAGLFEFVLVVLLALAGLFEFIAELEDVKADYKTPQAILYAALRLPNLAFQMFPVSALIGSLLGLGGLAANSEVIVMRASGLSVGRLAGMVAFAGFVMLVITRDARDHGAARGVHWSSIGLLRSQYARRSALR